MKICLNFIVLNSIEGIQVHCHSISQNSFISLSLLDSTPKADIFQVLNTEHLIP